MNRLGLAVAALLCTLALNVRTQTGLLQAADIEYLGGFRLPVVDDGLYGTFDYSNAAVAYFPGGDSAGPADGYPGSLFINGHLYASKVAELAIPAPVKSRTLTDLPIAKLLQPLTDARGGLGGGFIMGMTYVASENRIYWTSSDDYFNADCMPINLSAPTTPPALGSFLPTLSAPAARGSWYLAVGGRILHPYMTSRYIFELPKTLADASFGGNSLLSGRHRGWCSTNGPQLYAWKPAGAAPAADKTAISAVRVLQYGTEVGQVAHGFSPANNYQGAAYVATVDRAAVIISGLFDFDPSRTYYGYDNWKVSAKCDGIVPFPCTGTRGWRAADPHVALLFYNPSDFAAVVSGSKASYVPQPYARLDLTAFMLKAYPATMNVNSPGGETGIITIDRAHGLIYMTETRVDGTLRPVVHVFKVGSGSSSAPTPSRSLAPARR
jgi:hypothetical protein